MAHSELSIKTGRDNRTCLFYSCATIAEGWRVNSHALTKLTRNETRATRQWTSRNMAGRQYQSLGFLLSPYRVTKLQSFCRSSVPLTVTMVVKEDPRTRMMYDNNTFRTLLVPCKRLSSTPAMLTCTLARSRELTLVLLR